MHPKYYCMAGVILLGLSCKSSTDKNKAVVPTTKQATVNLISGYADVNGLHMYYEIYGKGKPLVLIHGGGSTIQSSFGRILPEISKHRQVIAVELQAHGHTPDVERAETFQQDADDVAALIKHLKLANVDVMGFSNGGNTAMQLAIRHPALVRKIVLASAFFKRAGMYPWFWTSIKQATLGDMPVLLKEAYKKVAPDTNGLAKMFEKDKSRMVNFSDWKAADIRSINAPALVIVGDQDVVLPEHAVEMYRLLPHARLAIMPATHGGYIGEATTGTEKSKIPLLIIAVIEDFLDEPG